MNNKYSNDMKEKIRKICTQLNDGQIAASQATEQLLDLFSVSCPLCGRGNRVTQKMLDAEYYVRAYIDKHDKPPTYRNVANHFDIAVCASHARLRHCRELMRARANGS